MIQFIWFVILKDFRWYDFKKCIIYDFKYFIVFKQSYHVTVFNDIEL